MMYHEGGGLPQKRKGGDLRLSQILTVTVSNRTIPYASQGVQNIFQIGCEE